MKLEGRKVWLIGASSGIGATLAPALAGEGAVLALSARREAELSRVADSCPGLTRPLVKALDVTDKTQVDRVYAELKEVWGQVDVLFYNAGTWSQAKVEVFDTDSALNQIDVLYMGLVRAVGVVMPDMIARRSGDIVGTASVAGYAGMPTAAPYTSAKSAINAFLQALRIELKGYGVGVVTVNPGFVKTPLTDRNTFPMPFMMTPEASAEAIIDGLLAGHDEIHYPKRLSWPLKLFTALPRPMYEWLAGKLMVRRQG